MPVTRKPDERLRDVSRRMILDRTAGLLVRQGYGATSLRDIAQACDMKAGSLYYHFDGKDALVEEIMTEGVKRVEASVLDALQAASGSPPLDRVRIAMEVHLRTLHDKSDYGSAHIRCFAHVPADIRHRLRSTRAGYDAVWARLLSEAQQAGAIAPDIDLHTLKFAIIGMMNWTLEWPLQNGVGPEEMANSFFRIAFMGAGQD
ncbi:TetR/AcrR family transcriptional regulator [Anianabacter salinae]|uniref:TetR/AcrR family transcriptional regulator n=1 Tax=Anianabacter salinae TaxID=2851023 RepID=UPI00225E5EC6|nr:TetR/AcrR family transcriptional regulator [Anianabacter salinae]MBV0912070.1 TetR/AcrR family transcriptional regulator [Anianabacter salinae]